jgi:hypothetical protein
MQPVHCCHLTHILFCLAKETGASESAARLVLQLLRVLWLANAKITLDYQILDPSCLAYA